MALNSILRDPLLHFLVLAVGLFVLHDAVVHEVAEAGRLSRGVDGGVSGVE